MPKLKQSASAKAQYKAYSGEGRHVKNKLTKLKRTVKNQPNNKMAQNALEKLINKGAKYTRARKSLGHICKGLYNSLGFEKNNLNEFMLKSKLGIQWYMGITKVNATTVPNHGQNMCEQFETLGYEKKKYVRKHKKTSK